MRDEEIPPKLKLSPKILEKVGAGKMVYNICIEYPLSVDRTPFFWDIDFRLKIENLVTTLLYVCEHILFSVQYQRVFSEI